MTNTSPFARRYILGVLVLVYTFNFIDRQILSILLEAIKADLLLSDQALGFLSGFAFAAFYATMGIPIAIWSDRGNRRNLIAIALSVWSIMTALSGLAQNFWHLALARIGVAIGEAGGSPPAHSLISDYYPPRQRATALGIYALGIPFGIMFGLFLGGWINEAFGWRKAFFIVGLPGLILALIVRFTVSEPERGISEKRQNEKVVKPSVQETFRYLLSKPAFVQISIANALAAFVGYGVITWYPTFLIRTHELGTAEIGLWLGLIMGLVGGGGMYLGGVLSDRFGGRDTRWYLWTPAVVLVVTVPFGVAGYIANDLLLVLLWFTPTILAGNFWQATSFAQVQTMAQLRMRSMASAILIFFINILGLGFGPWAVGILSDYLQPSYGSDSLRWSLCLISLLNIWAAYHFYLAGIKLAQDRTLFGSTENEKPESQT